MGFVEDLILRHPCRGMDILQPHLPGDFCREAAELIRSWPRGTVVLTTGFYVAGKAETDGPPGTLLLANALKRLDFQPVIVTDELCRGYFERKGFPVVYLDLNADDTAVEELLQKGRVDFIFPADYREGTGLDATVKNIIRKMAVTDLLAEEHAGQMSQIGKSDLPYQASLFE